MVDAGVDWKYVVTNGIVWIPAVTNGHQGDDFTNAIGNRKIAGYTPLPMVKLLAILFSCLLVFFDSYLLFCLSKPVLYNGLLILLLFCFQAC